MTRTFNYHRESGLADEGLCVEIVGKRCIPIFQLFQEMSALKIGWLYSFKESESRITVWSQLIESSLINQDKLFPYLFGGLMSSTLGS
jgi:hypothetical protein